MSSNIEKLAQDFVETFKTLSESEKSYIIGWLEAKADTHKTEKKKED